jgi:hypothetical protein
MAQVLAQFTDVLTDDNRISYRAHACGAEMADGRWQGWLEFIPLSGATPIRSGRETTQPNRTDVVYWASGLGLVYLQGALRRALHPRVRSTVEPGLPAFSEPAPPPAQSTTRARRQDAVLNPYLASERGEGPLRRQLGALTAWHLVNIIGAYQLSDTPIAALNHLPGSQLIDIIVDAVVNDS